MFKWLKINLGLVGVFELKMSLNVFKIFIDYILSKDFISVKINEVFVSFCWYFIIVKILEFLDFVILNCKLVIRWLN